MVSHPNRSKKAPLRKYKGVYEYLPGRFKARIRVGEKTIHLGVFTDPAEAAAKYQEAEIAFKGGPKSLIEKVRNIAGLTQPQASALVYKTEGAWKHYERGERRMPRDTWELFLRKVFEDNRITEEQYNQFIGEPDLSPPEPRTVKSA